MLAAMTAAAALAAGAIAPANARGTFGLYPADDFRLTDGRCTDCGVHPAALWYFEHETIAVPLPGRPIAGFSTSVRPFDDIPAWQSQRSSSAPIDYPPLVWIESPLSVRNATIALDAHSFSADGATTPLRLADKIPLNRSYFDASSARYFAARPVALRGTKAQDGGLIARTWWPEDFVLRALPPARALRDGVTPGLTLREWMREEPGGGAQSPYAAWTAWRNVRAPQDLSGRTVLAFMVNGAQGDDDEAHGGHFAIVTGRVAADGSIGDWLVNNFYTLDSESEKGIIAAPLPLDNYLGDLNSGQAWYRPSYMLVAVLSDERAAALVQSALGRVYNQFYRHQLVYYHPTQNCTSISVDTLRALGWDVPARGPSSRALAWAGFPFIAAKEMSVAKAKLAFDYLHTDQTRLLPAAALEEIFTDLLALGSNGANGSPGGPLAQMLAQDLDALVFLRFPQFPSNRVWGDAPAVTTWEYKTRVPSDPALAQIVPVPPRPFPERLRDPDLLPAPRHASDAAAWLWLIVPVMVAFAAIAWWRRRNGGG
ncbi:MAG TPA: hypothetical protein VIX61_03635 [Casimicrobiaceae bacterium]